MRILALDTALAACSAAIWDDGEIVAREFQDIGRGHAEALMPMVERVRAQAGLNYAQFDRLAVTVGPGAFAGIRVGLAAARGLAVACALPLVGLTTFEVLAAGAQAASMPLAVAIDARNDQVYFQQISDTMEPVAPPALISLTQAGKYLAGQETMLMGTGASVLAQTLDPATRAQCRIYEHTLPDAAAAAQLAVHRKAVPGHQVAPLYLRPPDAKLPEPRR